MKQGVQLLVMMVKEPLPGQVKTRLVPPLTPDEAAALYRCFVEDTAAGVRERYGTYDAAFAYTPENARDLFLHLSTLYRFGAFPQRGNTLGERLAHVFEEKLSSYNAVSVIGSDSPDLPRSFVLESFALLSSNRTDVVFGPCEDGGYYLVALRQNHRELFSGIPWGTGGVLSASLDKAGQMGLKCALLPRWRDIDTVDDLRNFRDKHRDAPFRRDSKTLSFLRKLGRNRVDSLLNYCGK